MSDEEEGIVGFIIGAIVMACFFVGTLFLVFANQEAVMEDSLSNVCQKMLGDVNAKLSDTESVEVLCELNGETIQVSNREQYRRSQTSTKEYVTLEEYNKKSKEGN